MSPFGSSLLNGTFHDKYTEHQTVELHLIREEMK